MNIFKHIFVLSLLSLWSYGALAQNTNGGVRIELRLDQVRANNISTDFGTEEATWILTPTFSDGVVGARYCYQLDADINGINYTTSPNSIVYTADKVCTRLYPTGVTFALESYEDDLGDRCTFDSDDDDQATSTTPSQTLPAAGAGWVTLGTFTYGAGMWAVTISARVTQLTPAYDFSTAQVQCELDGSGLYTGQYFVKIPFTKSAAAGASTVNITSTIPNTGDNPSTAAAGATGIMSFGPYAFGSTYDISLSYTSGGAPATCSQTFRRVNVRDCESCPVIASSTASKDNCTGNTVALACTILPITAVEKDNYFIQWQRSTDGGVTFTDIAGANSYGADGLRGTADDPATMLTYNYTLPSASNCQFVDNVFRARLYCVKQATIQMTGTGGDASTTPSEGIGSYYNYTQPITNIASDLTSLPSTARAMSFDYSYALASGGTYGTSWICEAIAQVSTPGPSAGPFCHTSLNDMNNGQCALYPGDNEQLGTLAQETCPSTPGAGTGSVTGSGSYDLGGYGSTVPAKGIWAMQFYDVYNDNGNSPEGQINRANMLVRYFLPPASGADNPATTSVVNAINTGATTLATGPVSSATSPNGAGRVEGLRHCENASLGIDYTVPSTCGGAVTLLCDDFAFSGVNAGLTPSSVGFNNVAALAEIAAPSNRNIQGAVVLYSYNGAAGPYDKFTPPSNVINGSLVYFRILKPNCPSCATTTLNYTVGGCCPMLTDVTANGEGCSGTTVNLIATVSNGVEGVDYYVQWFDNGTAISGAATFGADGIYGNADDPVGGVKSYSHTLNFNNALNHCAYQDHNYEARLYCLSSSTTNVGDITSTSTVPASRIGVYYNYTQPLSGVNVNLTSLPLGVIAESFNYSIRVASGGSYGTSYICEVVAEVATPAGVAGPYCYAPNPSVANCAYTYASFPDIDETCSGTGAGAGSYLFSGNQILGGINSTTPARGTWSINLWDTYDDKGTAAEGQINGINMIVKYHYPPGIGINTASKSIRKARNISGTGTGLVGAGQSANGSDLNDVVAFDLDNNGTTEQYISAVRVCRQPQSGTDYVLPTGCALPVTINCTQFAGNVNAPNDEPGVVLRYSADGTLGTYTLTNASDAVSSPLTPTSPDKTVHYRIYQPSCKACTEITGSYTLTFPNSPTTETEKICQGATAKSLDATEPLPIDCISYRWYDAATGGLLLATGTSYLPTVTAPGTYTYYAGCVDANSCESARTAFTYVIATRPTAPVAATLELCKNAALPTSYTLIGASPTSTFNTHVGGALVQSNVTTANLTLSGYAVNTAIPATYTILFSEMLTSGGLTCESETATLSVLVRQAPATPLISSNSPVCLGQNISLFTGAILGGGTYSWSGPNGFVSSDQNPTVFNATAANAGNYSVTITNSSNCSVASAAHVVVVNANPTVTLPANFSSCGGTGNNVTITGAPSGGTYSWTGPNGFLSSVQNPIISNVSASNSGTYSLTYTNASGCKSVATTQVLINQAPDAVALSTNAPLCEGGLLNVNTTPSSVAGTTYTWTRNGAGFGAANSPSLTFDPVSVAQAGTYAVTVTAPGGCATTGSIAVAVNATPIAPVVGVNVTACQGSSINLSVTNATSYPANYIFNWTGPNGYAATGASATIPNSTSNMSGGYSVYVSTTSNCRSSIATQNVVVNAIPEAALLSTNAPLCEGGRVTVNTTPSSVAGTTYTWTRNGAAFGAANSPSLTFDPVSVAQAGTYAVTMTAPGGCATTGSIAVAVRARPTVVVSNNARECMSMDEDIQFTSTVTNGTQPYAYRWTGVGGFAAAAANPILPNVNNAYSGNYQLVVTDANGCSSTFATMVVDATVRPIQPQIVGNSSACVGNTVTLSVLQYAGNVVNYAWITPNGTLIRNGAGNNQLTINPVTLSNAGNYRLVVTVDGCVSDTAVIHKLQVDAVPQITSWSGVGTFCEGDNTAITAIHNAPRGSVFTWTGPNGFLASGIDLDVLPRPFLMPSNSGYYNLEITTPGGCKAIKIGASLFVKPRPSTPALSSNSPICLGTRLQLNTQPYSGNSVMYHWANERNQLDSTNIPSISVDTFRFGHFDNYTVSIEVDGCSSLPSGRVPVYVNALPSALASVTTPVCEGTVVQFDATNRLNYLYNWSGPNGFSSNLRNPIIANASSLNSGTYQLWVRDANTGCSMTTASTVSLAVNPSAKVPTIINNTPVCSGADVVLSVSADSTQSGKYYWYDQRTNALVRTTNDGYWVIHNHVAGTTTYYVVVETSKGCRSNQSNRTEVRVESTSSELAYAGETIYGCLGSLISLNAQQPTTGQGQWTQPNYQRNRGVKIINLANPQTVVTDLMTGRNVFYWSISNGVCGNQASDSVEVYYENPVAPTANFDYQQMPFNASPITFNVLANDSRANLASVQITIDEQPRNGKAEILADGQLKYTPNPTFMGYERLVYKICSRNCNNLCDTAMVNIKVGNFTGCDVPNIITPNGDGTNDELIIPCLTFDYPNNEMVVFNRYGDEVFRRSGYRNNWQGTYNGEPLPEGTYFYLLRLGDATNTILQGYLMIHR